MSERSPLIWLPVSVEVHPDPVDETSTCARWMSAAKTTAYDDPPHTAGCQPPSAGGMTASFRGTAEAVKQNIHDASAERARGTVKGAIRGAIEGTREAFSEKPSSIGDDAPAA